MKVGDKVLCEGEINMIGEGFCRVAFGRVGTQAVTHVRIANEDIQKPRGPKPKVVDAPAAD